MLSVLATATEHMTLATKGQNGTYAEAQRMLGFTTNKTFSGAGEKLTAAAAPLSLSDGPGPDDAPEPVRPWKRHQVTGRGCEHAHSLPVFVYVVCVACLLACSRALVDAFAGIQAQVPRASTQVTRLTRPSGHVIMHPMPQAQGQMQL